MGSTFVVVVLALLAYICGSIIGILLIGAMIYLLGALVDSQVKTPPIGRHHDKQPGGS